MFKFHSLFKATLFLKLLGINFIWIFTPKKQQQRLWFWKCRILSYLWSSKGWITLNLVAFSFISPSHYQSIILLNLVKYNRGILYIFIWEDPQFFFPFFLRFFSEKKPLKGGTLWLFIQQYFCTKIVVYNTSLDFFEQPLLIFIIYDGNAGGWMSMTL